jgi:hypothetical protein
MGKEEDYERPMTKTGRNDLCLCGSGKKYKKCCGSVAAKGPATVRPTDITLSAYDYDDALEAVTDYFDKMPDGDEETDELKAQAAWFYLLYEPGTELGVPDSVFLPWLYFDIFIGSSKRTLAEKYMESSEFADLSATTQEAVRRLSASYPSFYRITNQGAASFVCRELGTHLEWTVTADDEDDLMMDGENELFHMRLLGSCDDAWIFDIPWRVDEEWAEGLEYLFEARWDDVQKTTSSLSDAALDFGKFNKTLSSFWIGYANGQIEIPPDEDGFHLLNTEGHPLRFCEMIFRITNKSSLEAGLSECPDFEYHEDENLWVWTENIDEADEDMDFLAPEVADIHIDGKKLVCNANSKERIEHLRGRIEEIAPGTVVYEKIDVQELRLDELEMSEPETMSRKRRR